ncbi:MAG TPA: 30S ribosomal protein S16 [Longimicrobiales bacterium]|nr:30S ribosomal protein S16 [Longimicrobiales bacterium]
MSVKIRLRRTGRKKQPSYRLIVADSTTPRNGQYLDSLGTYNPLTKPADLRIDLEKVDRWLADGAELSETAASLIRKARIGGDRKVAVRGVGPDEKAETASVVPAAEPAKTRARAGSRGAAKAADATGAAAVDAAAESSAQPAAEATTEPAAEATAEPAADATAEPAADATAEPAAEAMAEPTAEATAEPAAEAMAEPTADTSAEPAADAEAQDRARNAADAAE